MLTPGRAEVVSGRELGAVGRGDRPRPASAAWPGREAQGGQAKESVLATAIEAVLGSRVPRRGLAGGAAFRGRAWPCGNLDLMPYWPFARRESRRGRGRAAGIDRVPIEETSSGATCRTLSAAHERQAHGYTLRGRGDLLSRPRGPCRSSKRASRPTGTRRSSIADKAGTLAARRAAGRGGGALAARPDHRALPAHAACPPSPRGASSRRARFRS